MPDQHRTESDQIGADHGMRASDAPRVPPFCGHGRGRIQPAAGNTAETAYLTRRRNQLGQTRVLR